MVRYFTIPGYGGNDEYHWQANWEKTLPNCARIEQKAWENVNKNAWVARLEEVLQDKDLHDIVLIGHSLGVATIIHWAAQFGHKIRGALLVAPTDVDNFAEPIEAKGFALLPMQKLKFPSIVVSSTNDIWINPLRAREFAQSWGSDFVNIGDCGHINSASNLGDWPIGREILARL